MVTVFNWIENTIRDGGSTALYTDTLYTLLTLFTLFTRLKPFTLFILYKLLYTAETLACIPIYIVVLKMTPNILLLRRLDQIPLVSSEVERLLQQAGL